MDDAYQDAGGGMALPMNPGGTGVAVQTSIGGIMQIRRAAVAMPRSIDRVKNEIRQLAELVEVIGGETGGDTWEYRFPVKNSRTGKTDWIEGPTIKLSNVIARCWGNCSLDVTRVDDLGQAWVIYSTFIDYQTGFQLTRAFQQRKGQSSVRESRRQEGRGEDLAFQIGVSKSMRNTVVNALGDVVAYALRIKDQRWRATIEKDPDSYRERIRTRLEQIGYPLRKVEAYVGLGKIEKWTATAIAQISKILAAHAEGTLENLDDVFAPSGIPVAEEAPQPTVAPLVVELFDADGTGYRLQPGEIESWAARQATDATPDQLDQLLEHNRGAAAHVLALIETAIQNEINRRGGGDPEPRPAEARQQPTAPEPPRPAAKRPAPASEPPAGSGTVTWRGKSYPERPGYAVRMALETLNQCGDWGAVVRVKSEVESLIAQLRAVEHPGAEQVAKALADAEAEFERPANDDDDGPEYSDEGEPEPAAAEGDTAERWLAAAVAKIDGAPTLGHVRVYGRQLRDEAENREFDAGVVAQLNAALEAKENALSGA